MKSQLLPEPELEFRASNRHIDPRFGIADYGPADADTPTAPTQIPVGLVGSSRSVDSLRRWLEQCRNSIDGKTAKPGQDNMYPAFPGFNTNTAFTSQIVFDDALTREVSDREIRSVVGTDKTRTVAEAADLFFAEAKSLSETGRCRVIICARPDELEDEPTVAHPVDEEAAEGQQEESASDVTGDFHDVVKAKSLTLSCPLQLIRRDTWEGKASGKGERKRRLQDEATRAWNLHTALYYKAGGTPWRLPRASTDLTSCYVGVSFFRTTDESALHTAVAQVFNERGDGVVVRGGAAKISKADRQPHLSEEDSCQLLTDALAEYKRVHGNLPARVVLHKSSSFDPREAAAFTLATDQKEVGHLEMVWIQRRWAPRLFRNGQLPPLRGTALELDQNALVLYTRGSIPFFRTYPGMYVPWPLLLRPTGACDLARAAADVLALSKMNWNNAQLDERDPLTLRTAQRVGNILKHIGTEGGIATRYAYYM